MYHSNSVLSALSSSWTSKPPLAIRYRLDTAALEESGGRKSHGSTLERLLAWEKKLYQEVKVIYIASPMQSNVCNSILLFPIIVILHFTDCKPSCLVDIQLQEFVPAFRVSEVHLVELSNS